MEELKNNFIHDIIDADIAEKIPKAIMGSRYRTTKQEQKVSSPQQTPKNTIAQIAKNSRS